MNRYHYRHWLLGRPGYLGRFEERNRASGRENCVCVRRRFGFELLEERRLLDAFGLESLADDIAADVFAAPPSEEIDLGDGSPFRHALSKGRGKGRILHVDADATGRNDGSSWKDALPNGA